MTQKIVELSAPADPTFARSVRMMAANLAVLCKMNVDELEDVKLILTWVMRIQLSLRQIILSH